MYRVVLPKRVEKSLRNLPAKEQMRVIQALEGLQDDPLAGKNLKGTLEGIYSIRVWPLRILYEIRRKERDVLILFIGHRKDAYK